MTDIIYTKKRGGRVNLTQEIRIREEQLQLIINNNKFHGNKDKCIKNKQNQIKELKSFIPEALKQMETEKPQPASRS